MRIRNNMFKASITLSIIMAVLVYAVLAFAQAEVAETASNTTATAAAVAANGEVQGSSFFLLIDRIITGFRKGGPFMYLILLVSFFALAIFIERLYSLVMRYDINGIALINRVQNFVVDNQVDKAIKLCNEAPYAVLPTVLKAGLKRATRNQAEIQAAVDVATLEVLSRLQKRTPYLSMLANVATLAGLLGTIIGLMDAFDAVAFADPAQRQSLLSAGIAVAMNTTAFGLIVAIPCLLGFGFLTSKTAKIVDEIDTCSAKLVDLLTIAGKRS